MEFGVIVARLITELSLLIPWALRVRFEFSCSFLNHASLSFFIPPPLLSGFSLVPHLLIFDPFRNRWGVGQSEVFVTVRHERYLNLCTVRMLKGSEVRRQA